MGAKLIKYSFEAKDSIKNGVDKIVNVVKVTLGPAGRSVILDKGYGSPTVTDDGVTVAKDIELEDKFENVGASLIQEVANRTNEEAGDGTTTAMVLAQKMIEEAFASRDISFSKPNEIKQGMELAARYVVSELRKMKKDIRDKEEIEQVATIASLDTEVGKLIAEAMDEVGHDGVITVEEGQTIGLEKEVVKGMRFDRGFVSPYMVTNPERMEAVWEDAAILVTDQKIAAVSDILPLLEGLAQSGRKNLVVIADEIEGEALATFIVNKIRGTFNVLAVKAPGFGDRKKEMLADIAVLTGAQVISEELGVKLDSANVSHLGTARKIVATKEHTTIIAGGGDKQKITDRVARIRNELGNVTSDFDREKLQERLAKLAGGVGVIKVGAFTETEMKAKKFKIEDALNATKAAVEEGIIAGGGAPFAKIATRIFNHFENVKLSPAQMAGVKIIRRALEAPLRQIAENAGVDPTGIINEIQQSDAEHAGYDFTKYDPSDWKKGLEADMMKAGIVDPLKVARLALENAVSIASTLVTSEAIVVDKPEPKHPSAAGGSTMSGMDY